MSKKSIVLTAIENVLGRRSSAYIDLVSAIENNDNLSLILCQQALESLPIETKTELWTMVRDLEEAQANGMIRDEDDIRDTA
jgi:hypothetical protein